MKENYRRWYGIPGLEFIWNGEWSDPEIKVHACKSQNVRSSIVKVGAVFNIHDVEDCMWLNYNEDCKENNLEPTYEDFAKYMSDHTDEVWDYVYGALGGTW